MLISYFSNPFAPLFLVFLICCIPSRRGVEFLVRSTVRQNHFVIGIASLQLNIYSTLNFISRTKEGEYLTSRPRIYTRLEAIWGFKYQVQPGYTTSLTIQPATD